MKQLKLKKELLLSTALLFVILVGYNNCAGQKFTFAPSEFFNPTSIEDINCMKMVELSLPEDGSALNIPARDGDGICYSVKLISRVASHPSSTNPNHDLDVIAANHDLDPKLNNSNPALLGKKVANLFLEGPRSIMLSGSSNGESEILVDNFILVGVMKTSEIYNPSYYKAYGTADCKIHNVPGNALGMTSPYNDEDGSRYISYKNHPVELIKFASGGTASVVPWRLDGSMETNRYYSIDFRALDCGIIGENSDIYLTFQ